MEDRIAMSQKERDVLKVMGLVLKGQRTRAEAARLLDLSDRQIRRILKRLREHGDAGVVHRLQGRPSNRRHNPTLQQQALAIYRQDYTDFGPTLAADEFADRGIDLSVDALLRKWGRMVALYTDRHSMFWGQSEGCLCRTDR